MAEIINAVIFCLKTHVTCSHGANSLPVQSFSLVVHDTSQWIGVKYRCNKIWVLFVEITIQLREGENQKDNAWYTMYQHCTHSYTVLAGVAVLVYWKEWG